MVQLVNGFPCHNPAQIALAKRGIDPAAGQAAGAPAATHAASGTRNPAPTTDFSRVGRGRFVDLIT